MALPGLLVEYLINGAIALIWLYPLLKKFELIDVNSSYLPLLAPGLYVVGMVIDYIALISIRPIKHRIRRRIEEKYGVESLYTPGKAHLRQVKFAIYAPEIAKEFAMRSSRDRIARGAIINSVIATIIISILRTNLLLTLLLGLFSILINFIMWVGFEKASFSYELKAEQAVDEKIEYDRSKATV
jgi:hypothetical protein